MLRVTIVDNDTVFRDKLTSHITYHYYADIIGFNCMVDLVQHTRVNRWEPGIVIVGDLRQSLHDLAIQTILGYFGQHPILTEVKSTHPPRPYLIAATVSMSRRWKALCEEFGFDVAVQKSQINSGTIQHWVHTARKARKDAK